MRLVALIVLAAMVVGAIVTAAFGRDESSPVGVFINWVPNGSPAATITRLPGDTPSSPTHATQEPVRTVDAAVSGFLFPIEGGCLPGGDNLMPGAPRDYRNGTHEGVDFYASDSCVFVGSGTEVVAAKAGTVVRADWDYEDLTEATLAELEALVEQGAITADVVDAFRGRQVWIEHADGMVTRYAHLAGIVETVDVGSTVSAGEPIAYVGESGTPESVTDPGTQFHAHFEIRIGESYLGAGLDAETVRSLYEAAFGP